MCVLVQKLKADGGKRGRKGERDVDDDDVEKYLGLKDGKSFKKFKKN